MEREMKLRVDCFTFHRNTLGWKVNLHVTFYIDHNIKKWILFPSEMSWERV